jgi:SsrA-binding protein
MAGKKKDKDENVKLIARNRRARFEYHLIMAVEAGLVLLGTEVKSLRDGKASLEDAHAKVTPEGEVFLYDLNIPEYSHGNRENHEPKRRRKLLLHASEIRKITQKAKEKGMTLVPTRLYFKKGWAKIEIALAVGKKSFDKRQDMRDKDAKRDMDRALSSRSRE